MSEALESLVAINPEGINLGNASELAARTA